MQTEFWKTANTHTQTHAGYTVTTHCFARLYLCTTFECTTKALISTEFRNCAIYIKSCHKETIHTTREPVKVLCFPEPKVDLKSLCVIRPCFFWRCRVEADVVQHTAPIWAATISWTVTICLLLHAYNWFVSAEVYLTVYFTSGHLER